MGRITLGMLAHVDAGKTTLSEALLYTCGEIRNLGRVDNRDAFLDTDEQERKRGITIFSKQARLTLGEWEVTLLDTPGHVDFSAEMERTLSVLDYALLIISGTDGVQSHTLTLWRLLKEYRIPVFIFVNKTDQPGADPAKLLAELKQELSENCVDFTEDDTEAFYENAAVCEEQALEQFLDEGSISGETLQQMIKDRRIFPVLSGSALKLTGVDRLLETLKEYWIEKPYPKDFGARVFKITRDAQGNRLTWLKITGGRLLVKDVLPGCMEKVNQIRLYSGTRYDTVPEAEAGTICAVTGPEGTLPGQGLGVEEGRLLPFLQPVLTYRILLPEEVDVRTVLPGFKQIEEELPELHLVWKEALQELQVQVMGQVQIEILQNLVRDRLGIEIRFGQGQILYQETITAPVEGVGHYEPLRHYAEVHLLLEPLPRGSGLQFETAVSTDELDRNWQRLVLTHLQEREQHGVLTGAPVTDMRVTLVAGKAHLKHTEGGDFRQATYRALRQGLMEAYVRGQVLLLEPSYRFELTIPETLVGRAMTDLDRRSAKFTLQHTDTGQAVITGTIPAACVTDYQKELQAYSGGRGKLACSFDGYIPCHDPEEVLENTDYDPLQDPEYPADSVFCAHGAGFVVPWYEVGDYMHLPFAVKTGTAEGQMPEGTDPGAEMWQRSIREKQERKNSGVSESIGTEEIDAILAKTFYANKRDGVQPRYGYQTTRRETALPTTVVYKGTAKRPEYLLVDGYNVIFAWQELKELAAVNMDSARGKLLDELCNYQAIRGCELIVVFDAYRVEGHKEELADYHNIHVIYTKEAETADQYIEKFAHEHHGKYAITVATSDGLEQIIIRGQGCTLMSSRELEEEVSRSRLQNYESYRESQPRAAYRPFDKLNLPDTEKS